MSVRHLLLAVRRRWLLALGLVIATFGVSAYTAFAAPSSYVAHNELIVSSSGSEATDTLLQGGNLVMARVPSYTGLVNSRLVIEPVIQRLGLNESPEAVAQQVEASNPLGTALIDVTVRDHTAEGAYSLATEIGIVLGKVIEGVETPGDGRTPVSVTVVRPPELPGGPDRSGTTRGLATGLLLGLLLGVGAAIIRDRIDATVKDYEDLRRKGVPTLAELTMDPRAGGLPLAIHDAAQLSSSGAGFRQLRTILQALMSAEGLQSVLVTGPTTEDQSSAVARNVAVAFGQTRMRVILVEANMRDSHEANMRDSNVADPPKAAGRSGLSDVLAGTAEATSVIQPWLAGTVDILPAGSPTTDPSDLLASDAMSQLVRNLERDYDVVVLDSPPFLLATDTISLATKVDGTLVTLRLNQTSERAVMDTVQALRNVNARIFGAIVLQHQSRHGRGQSHFGRFANGSLRIPSGRLREGPPADPAGSTDIDTRRHQRSITARPGAANVEERSAAEDRRPNQPARGVAVVHDRPHNDQPITKGG